jgi:ABC transporter substrate binding protein
MKRREFITLLGGAAAAWPLAARAQQDRRVRWIGALMIYTDSEKPGLESATVFEESLVSLGWHVGRNVAIDYRWAVTDVENGRSAVAQVLRLSPDLILANGGPALTAAQQATRTVPIVFTGVSEPVERGFITSLAHPGGSTTGFANMESTVGGKWHGDPSNQFCPYFADQLFGAYLRSILGLATEIVAAVFIRPNENPARAKGRGWATHWRGRRPGGRSGSSCLPDYGVRQSQDAMGQHGAHVREVERPLALVVGELDLALRQVRARLHG